MWCPFNILYNIIIYRNKHNLNHAYKSILSVSFIRNKHKRKKNISHSSKVVAFVYGTDAAAVGIVSDNAAPVNS